MKTKYLSKLSTYLFLCIIYSYSQDEIDSFQAIPLQFPFLGNNSISNDKIDDSIKLIEREIIFNRALYRGFYSYYLFSTKCKKFPTDTVINKPFIQFVKSFKDCDVIKINELNDPLEKYFTYIPLTPKISYIRFDAFNDSIEKKLYSVYRELTDKKIIVDLRNNSGGTIQSIKTICSMFLKRNKIICRMVGNKCKGKTKIKSVDLKLSLPVLRNNIIVIVGDSTMSGAELFCAALVDNKRSVLIGSKTQGTIISKGSISINDSMLVMLPIYRILSPKGSEIFGRGIKPHISISSDEIFKNKFETTEDLIQQTCIDVLNDNKKYKSLLKMKINHYE